MGLASDIRKKIERKFQQLRELEVRRADIDIQMRETSAAIQAYEEILKLTPPDVESGEPQEPNIRTGSLADLARAALRKHGKPMHVSKILEALGREPSHDNKVSLSGSLSAYVRQRKIFTKPDPNVFGLIEWETTKDVTDALLNDEIGVDEALEELTVAQK